jgi:hypothetical protein
MNLVEKYDRILAGGNTHKWKWSSNNMPRPSGLKNEGT